MVNPKFQTESWQLAWDQRKKEFLASAKFMMDEEAFSALEAVLLEDGLNEKDFKQIVQARDKTGVLVFVPDGKCLVMGQERDMDMLMMGMGAKMYKVRSNKSEELKSKGEE